jgi:hypothetical protein
MVKLGATDRLTFRRLSFFIPESLNDGLKALKERDGVAEAESIRRALIAYLREKGVLAEPRAARSKPRKGAK